MVLSSFSQTPESTVYPMTVGHVGHCLSVESVATIVTLLILSTEAALTGDIVLLLLTHFPSLQKCLKLLLSQQLSISVPFSQWLTYTPLWKGPIMIKGRPGKRPEHLLFNVICLAVSISIFNLGYAMVKRQKYLCPQGNSVATMYCSHVNEEKG